MLRIELVTRGKAIFTFPRGNITSASTKECTLFVRDATRDFL